MGAGEATIAIVHLSAVVAVLTLAYLGVDRFSLEPESFEEVFDRAKAEAERVCAAVNITTDELRDLGNSKFLTESQTITLLCVICAVIGEKPRLKKAGQKWHAFWSKLKHVPLIGMFRSGLHRHVVQLLALATTLILLYATALLIAGRVLTPSSLWFFYAILVFALGWMAFTGAVAKKMRPPVLLALVENLGGLVEGQMREQFDANLQRAEEYRRRLGGAQPAAADVV